MRQLSSSVSGSPRRLTASDVAVAYNALSGAEQSRVATLVAHGVPRADAVSVVWAQHQARTANRPATRTRVISRQRIRQTTDERKDGTLVTIPVRREGTHRAYAVQGVYA